MTTAALVFIGALSRLVSPFANYTFDRLTFIPHTAWKATNGTLERNVLVESHTDNTCAGRNIAKARVTLVRDIYDPVERMERQTQTIVGSLRGIVVQIDTGVRRI